LTDSYWAHLWVQHLKLADLTAIEVIIGREERKRRACEYFLKRIPKGYHTSKSLHTEYLPSNLELHSTLDCLKVEMMAY